MPSYLTFPSTETFRNKLLNRNLSPYTVPGSYTPPSGNIVQEIVIRDIGVENQDDSLIENPPANQGPKFHGLYNLNEYGPQSGFGDTIIQSQPNVLTSNKGEYDLSDTSLPQQSLDGSTWPSYYSNAIAENDIAAVNRWGFSTIQLAQIGNLILTPKYEEYDSTNASLPQQSLNGNTWPAYNSSAISEEDIPSVNKYSFDFVQLALIGNLILTPIYEKYDISQTSLPQQSLDGNTWPSYYSNAISQNEISSVNKYGLPSIILYQINDLILQATYGQYDSTKATLPAQSLTGLSWPAYNQGIPENQIPSVNKWSTSNINLVSASNIILPPKYEEYDSTNASLPAQSLTGLGWPSYNQGIPENQIPSINLYSNPSTGPLLYSVDSKIMTPSFTPYGAPSSFVPSSYSPYQLLLQDNPTGSDGSLSQDSFIARLGAEILKKEFQSRIASELRQNTIGRINLQNAVSDPVYALRIAQGKTPIIERDWVITRPGNLAVAAIDFAARLGGFYFPGSAIPGDYFTADEQNLSSFGQIAAAFNGGKDPRGGGFGKLFGRFLSQKSPSQLFLDNTGGGQKSQLYSNLKFNRYAPDYNRGLIGEFLQGAKKIINDVLDTPAKGGYYVGSKEVNATYIDTPSGDLPLNSFGQEVEAPVYGPDKIAKLYEGDEVNTKFKTGLGGNSFTDRGGLDGGLVWTSPKYNNPGYKALVGGDQGPQDSEYNLVKSQIESDLTQGFEFKAGSILDQTQRLVDSTPDGAKRLSHVGNAINQLSKVFNDGYKEITKGSKVLAYSNPAKGIHTTDNVYCRVFTKDTPYYTFADLQKTDGNHRKFTYSILDNTYNLNIAPFRNPGSTNIVNDRVKKYMFSIENLAWRTSNRPGLTYNDLPVCERGPNGGRVMWFPPYDLKFSETSTPAFVDNSFLGRPEPIYTYTNTKRDGTLSWKIIVDHPSVLNLIVDKELRTADPQTINAVVDSFFAGCLKYDLYELARRWNTFKTSELFELQQIITNPTIKPEYVEQISSEIPVATQIEEVKVPNVEIPDFSKFTNIGFYFDNDYPTPKSWATTTTNTFQQEYSRYLGLQTTYETNGGAEVNNFFNNVIIDNFNYFKTVLIPEIKKYFEVFKNSGDESKPSLTITLVGSASAPNTKAYNVNLSKRRISSVQNFLNQDTDLKGYLADGSLKIIDGGGQGEGATGITAKSSNGATYTIDSCTDNDPSTNKSKDIYTVNAMGCRRVGITKIDPKKPEPKKTITPIGGGQNNGNNGTETPPGYTPATPVAPTITTSQRIREGISKKILRSILSECDYFSMIQESNPMFYDTMKEKIKYFSPTFHSITPEGLNSRLTFLQQCTRPGDTIPVIGTDGKPKYTSSVNTAFGAPPVLVLRIGDFYNTKIIPTSMNITYEPLVLDMNPEGIGVQPMIANISLGFHFVGGQGLKEPIDKLQNALSFNFYANTEMYDDRADWTDDSFQKIDQELVKAILDQTPVVGVNDVKNNIENDGGDTIGVIDEKYVNDAGQTSGTTSFQKIMDGLLSSGQIYLESVTNKTIQITKDFNLPIAKLFTKDRKYVDGKTNEFTTPVNLQIYGKPDSIDTQVTALFDAVINDINQVTNKNSDGFTFIKSLYEKNFKNTTVSQVKINLINEVKKAQADIINSLGQVNNELTQNQVNLVKVFAKLDVVDTKTDGYIKSDQKAKVYNLTATTEVQAGSTQPNTYDELVNDYNSGVTSLYSFYTLLKDKGFVDSNFDINNITMIEGGFTNPTCPNCQNAEKRFYTAMSRVLLNPNTFQTFKNLVIPTTIASESVGGYTLNNAFDDSFGVRVEIYNKEHISEIKYVNDNLETVYNSTYKEWKPFVPGKTRKFLFSDYTSGTTVQETRIQNLYKNGNSNTDNKTFNGKNKFN